MESLLIAKCYELRKKIGAGAFGEIYMARSNKDKHEYAIKLEERRCKYPQLKYEYKLYNHLHAKNEKKNPGKFLGIPKVYYYNTEG